MIRIISGLEVEITRKKIKNMYLSVRPGGKIHISAPNRMTNREIELFVNSKIDWINDKLLKMSEIPTERQYKDGETVYAFGEKYILSVNIGEKNSVSCHDCHIFLTVKNPDTDRSYVLNEWYRKILKEKVSALLPIWEEKTGLYSQSWQIKNMKTRWGSCNISTKKIWLNLQLAKMPEICLEYVILHELSHLAVSNHGPEFKKLLDKFMPDWREVKKFLNTEYLKMQ